MNNSALVYFSSPSCDYFVWEGPYSQPPVNSCLLKKIDHPGVRTDDMAAAAVIVADGAVSGPPNCSMIQEGQQFASDQ